MASDTSNVLPYLSVSRCKTYACPYRYQQLYQHNIQEPASDAALRGREVHRLIAESLREDYPMAEFGPVHTPNAPPPSPAIMAESADLFAEWQTSFETGDMEPLGIEVRAEAALDDMTPFRGYLDLVCEWKGMLVIYDWKSGWQMPAALGDDPQLVSYAWLATERWGARPVLIRQYYVRYGRYVEMQVGPSAISNARITLGEFATRLRAADTEAEWPAQPGPHCAYCRTLCPLEWMAAVAPRQYQEARALAQRVHALGVKYGEAKDALKSWCEVHGDISAAGRTWGLACSEAEKAVLSPQELVARYGEAGWALLKVKDKIPKGRPDGLETVTKFGNPTFRERKADGND